MTIPENTDEIWRRAEIDSPCVKVCVIHPEARICVGCQRSIEEIAAWSAMTTAERRAVMSQLAGRKAVLRQRRGGRAARLARE